MSNRRLVAIPSGAEDRRQSTCKYVSTSQANQAHHNQHQTSRLRNACWDWHVGILWNAELPINTNIIQVVDINVAVSVKVSTSPAKVALVLPIDSNLVEVNHVYVPVQVRIAKNRTDHVKPLSNCFICECLETAGQIVAIAIAIEILVTQSLAKNGTDIDSIAR